MRQRTESPTLQSMPYGWPPGHLRFCPWPPPLPDRGLVLRPTSTTAEQRAFGSWCHPAVGLTRPALAPYATTSRMRRPSGSSRISPVRDRRRFFRPVIRGRQGGEPGPDREGAGRTPGHTPLQGGRWRSPATGSACRMSADQARPSRTNAVVGEERTNCETAARPPSPL